MHTKYLVKLSATLTPVWHQDPPLISIGIDNDCRVTALDQTTTFDFEFETNGQCQFMVELLNKNDSDSIPELGLDKAVILDNLSFFGIADPKFIWSGVYEPKYPEPWATQQRSQGTELKSQLRNHTYLGWPGKWTLTFTVPVFTWIHETQNLGWIYG